MRTTPQPAPGPGLAPANLHISVTSPESTAPPLRERVEQKFFIRPDRMGLATALLFRACWRDPAFPDGQVNSLYFDTFEVQQTEFERLEQSIKGFLSGRLRGLSLESMSVVDGRVNLQYQYKQQAAFDWTAFASELNRSTAPTTVEIFVG